MHSSRQTNSNLKPRFFVQNLLKPNINENLEMITTLQWHFVTNYGYYDCIKYHDAHLSCIDVAAAGSAAAV